MPRYRKITGTHYRKQNGKEVCYRPGSVMEATEEEINSLNPKTWELVEDNIPTSGSVDGTRTKDHYLFVMRRNSKVLHPDRLALGEMFDASTELYLRETKDVDDEKKPIGYLAQAIRALNEAIDQWHYRNDVAPVAQRQDGPPQSEEIARCEAAIELLQEEIAVLKTRCHSEQQHDDEKAKRVAERKKAQAETLAYHPAYRENADAKKIRAQREQKKTPAKSSIKRLKRATA